QLDGAVRGNVDVHGFVEIDVGLVELVFGPELSGGQGRVDDGDHVILEHLARAQAGHGDVLLPVVGVNRGFALNGRGQILHIAVAGFDNASVFFQNSDVGNFHALVRRVIALEKLPPLLNSGFALDADAGDSLFAPGAIGLE